MGEGEGERWGRKRMGAEVRYPGQNLDFSLVDNTCLRASASVFYFVGVCESGRGGGFDKGSAVFAGTEAQINRSTDLPGCHPSTVRLAL